MHSPRDLLCGLALDPGQNVPQQVVGTCNTAAIADKGDAVQAQVENMTNKWAIYMTFDGRISMAGVSGAKCQYLAEAIADSYKQ